MNRSIVKTKLELLTKGIRLSESTLDRFPAYKYKRASLSEGICFDLSSDKWKKPIPINLPVHEAFAARSPYIFDENRSIILKNGSPFLNASIIYPPSWYADNLDDGTKYHEVFQLHHRSILATSLTNFCEYKSMGKGCHFCAMGHGIDRPKKKSPTQITSVLKNLLKKGHKFTEININSGCMVNEKASINLYRDAVMAVKSVEDIPIYAQLAPPSDLGELDSLVSEGIASLSFNIEIYDSKIRRELMPQKGKIPVEYYLKTLEYAAKLIGPGQVSSWLIAGLEPCQNTISAIEKITDLGVIPFVTVFRPLTGSDMESYPPPDPDSLLPIFETLEERLRKLNLDPESTLCGCVKCNCCSALQEIFT
ncbi:MAG: hypothetical protein HF978_13485 [Desulfobacteraceae bacterium]|nr:hypothetical protein [Desulfobacteraceae bacterium]MBC2756555.1 hypothetical protein [Desulfobacteraceae bacterium]